MPLLDHFHPPLSVERPWEGFHSAWTTAIVSHLNRNLLPPDYFAMPQVTVGVRVEADVATWEKRRPVQDGNGAVATKAWSPPKPALSNPVDFVALQSFEVQILQEMGGSKLRGVIELVSPANKDRDSHRRAFVIKCAAHLQQGISVIVVDVVTSRNANFHEELMRLLQQPPAMSWQSPTDLSAVAYRAVPWKDGDRLDVWTDSIRLAAPLPAMPLWLDADLCLPVPFEDTYQATCELLRIPN
jgi:hypothetical protein